MHLALIDGSAYAHRAYHTKTIISASNREPVGALRVFCSILRKTLADLDATHALIAWDAGRSGWRTDILPSYKANRKSPPDDFRRLLPLIRDAATEFGIASERLDGWEADDIIATHTALAVEAGARVTIYTQDKDMLQLTGPKCDLLNPQTGVRMGVAHCIAKFGVEPDKVADVQGLMGDAVDGIPGVPSIGPMGAKDLIRQFLTLEAVYEGLDTVRPKRTQDRLREHKAQAFTSRALARLSVNAPIDMGQSLRWSGIDTPRLGDFLRQHHLTGLASEIAAAG